MEKYQINSILVVKLDHIGDMVLSTPVFEAIKKRYPDCFLGVMCSTKGSVVLKNNPWVDRYWIFDADMFDREGSNNQETKAANLKSVLEIREMRFDVCVGLREDGNNIPILNLLGAKKTISFHTFTQYAALLDKSAEHIGDRHTAHINFDLLRLIDVPAPKELRPRIYFTDEDERWAADRLEEAGIRETHRLVGVSPGGGWFLNWWPWERYAELCRRLQEYDRDIRIVLFGGKAEREVCGEISRAVSLPLISAAGKGTVQETAALMNRMECVIANDGGPMHMATAAGTRVIALFGPSPTWFFPLGSGNTIIRKAFPCSPCPQFVKGEKPQCLDNRCMKAISVEEVYQAALDMLDGKSV